MAGTDLSMLTVPDELQNVRMTADIVADELRSAIRTGALPDGAPLSQTDLAQRFGVSRQPIREAMRQLSAEGLIDNRPRHGAVVRGISADRLSEIYDNRALIEGHLLMRAIPRLPTEALEQLKEQAAADASVTEVDTWLARSQDFHDALLKFAGDETAMELVAQLRAKAERYVHMWAGIGNLQQPDLAEGEHLAIIETILAGDAQGARELLETHVRESGRRLVDLGRRYAAAQ